MGILIPYLSPRDRSDRINKGAAELNIIHQVDPIDINKTFYPTIKYIFFSKARGTFSSTDHMLSHKASHSEFKKTNPTGIYSYLKAMKLQIRNRSKTRKFTNT